MSAHPSSPCRPPLAVQLAAAIRNPQLMRAGAALHANDLPAAERLLKAYLNENPFEVAAIRMLAELAARIRRYDDAEQLLARALELEPGFREARLNLAAILQRSEKVEAATREIDMLLAETPDDPAVLAIAAAVRVRRGDFDQAIAAYRQILGQMPEEPRLWLSLGHVLKTVGKSDEAIAAYREAIAQMPQLGDAWWSLANLKTFRFAACDIEAMQKALYGESSLDDRLHLHFALGKAFEDSGDYASAFAHYEAGNRARCGQIEYDASEFSAFVDHSIVSFTASTFISRADGEEQAADPIFIVGLPRSGSTLIEQILASHPDVEGTAELPHLPAIVRELVAARSDEDPRYIDVALRLSVEERAALGRRYLDRCSIQRKTGRPRFIDKLPNNFAHIGLIRLILPNATIIDARRDAMATCFSCFKQHFARGQEFTYSLSDVGRYWRDYVRLMSHYDEILPGAVHRVEHEQLLDDPEGTIRALLDHCRLAFDPGCLSFHHTARPVRTASAEQVRRPLNRDGVGRWRHFAPWLAPLTEALARS